MKKMGLQIVLIKMLRESELIHRILYILKKHWLFIMLSYSLSQLLIRIKEAITTIYI